MTFTRFNRARQNSLYLTGVLLCSIFAVNACTTSPATGGKVISFNTLAEEKRIGQREHPKIVKQFGGEYNLPKVKNYVSDLGHKLATISELPGIGWKFTVLNSREINAFAIPGGFIYVTRGLLTLASNEAELAGVIAHEIGHVTALHSSTRQATGKVAGLGTLAAGILLGRAGSELGSYIGRAGIQQYSQSQELEADSLGVRYLSRTGYDTRAMGSFLTKMRAFSKLENRRLGRPEDAMDRLSIFASHPRTLKRIERAIKTAARLKSGSRIRRVDYMAMLHGVVYGDDLEQGIIRGRDFIHPLLKFRFTVPEGFRLINNQNSVVATNIEGSSIHFDMGPKTYNGPMARYLKYVWASKARLNDVESIMVNGMDGAGGGATIQRRGGVFNLRFVAVRNKNNKIFRLLFVTPRLKTRQLSSELRRTTFSLRTLSNREASAITPATIRVKAVNADETIESIIQQMALTSFREQTFRVLNDLGPNENLRTGQLIKIVAKR